MFSNKAFPSRVLGLAWKGDPKKQSGICQKRRKEVHLKNYKDSSDLNLNSLFITLRTKSMQRIPLRFVEAWLRNWRLVRGLYHEVTDYNAKLNYRFFHFRSQPEVSG